VIGKDNPGVDMERCACAHLPDGVAQRIDARHQQVRPTVEQVHCKEERSTRNPIAAIIRYARPRRTAECAPRLGKNALHLVLWVLRDAPRLCRVVPQHKGLLLMALRKNASS
jgi:hypothetical protein